MNYNKKLFVILENANNGLGGDYVEITRDKVMYKTNYGNESYPVRSQVNYTHFRLE
jgi:hypothetical protein